MSNKTTIIPDGMEQGYKSFQFAPATRAGGLVFVSGQIGVGDDGKAIADLEAQFTRAFELAGVILKEAGCGFEDVVDLHTFHVDLQQTLETFMKVKAKFIPEPFPSWTAIGCTELALPGIAAEIKLVAAAKDA